MRRVSRVWARVIDAHPSLWRRASFKGTSFAPRVEAPSSPSAPCGLGRRPGARVLELAHAAGNEWAGFLRGVYGGRPLRAVTFPRACACALVRGAARLLPAPRARGGYDGMAVGWLLVHAARERGVPGAVVGVVFVEERVGGWGVVRAVALEKSISCAGFMGVWEVPGVLADWVIRGLHAQ